MAKVKICGITNLDDALAAMEYGADALGFVFAPSPRRITIERAAEIVSQLPPFVCTVGVFVDATLEQVREAISAAGLTLAQLHGSESPEFCQALAPRVIKSFRVGDKLALDELASYKVRGYLLDTYHPALHGGTGHSFDWKIARAARRMGLVILSGGLNPSNVCQAIEQAEPYAVDVSSGIERHPGKKDHAKMRAFIEAAKGAR
jgi:phosphoribosylanthranilate isomerase